MQRSLTSIFSALTLGLSLALAASTASAATLGGVKAGEKFARANCASCHSIEPGAKTSPVIKATPFQIFANTPGVNRTALIVFLRTPHPTMPNLIVDGEDADDIIAYILSLKNN